MLIVRGVNVFPAAIREVVSAFAPDERQILVRPRAAGEAGAAAARQRRARPSGAPRRGARAARSETGCARCSSSGRRSTSSPRGACRGASTSRSWSSGRERDRHHRRRQLSAAGLADRPRAPRRALAALRARELWRPEPFLEHAQDDATRLAVADMERAGGRDHRRRDAPRELLEPVRDGTRGVDLDEPGVALDRTGQNPVPRVVGPIRRARPVETRDVEFLRSLTDRRIKITVPGPFTMTQQAQNDHYSDDRASRSRTQRPSTRSCGTWAAGADLVQIDEPYLQARPEAAREYAVEAIDRALDGIAGETVLHTCFGYAHIVHERLPGYPFLHELADCRPLHLARGGAARL